MTFTALYDDKKKYYHYFYSQNESVHYIEYTFRHIVTPYTKLLYHFFLYHFLEKKIRRYQKKTEKVKSDVRQNSGEQKNNNRRLT